MTAIYFAIDSEVLEENPLIKKEPPAKTFLTAVYPKYSWILEKKNIVCGIVRQTAGDMVEELRSFAEEGRTYTICQGSLSQHQVMFMTNMVIAGSEPTNLDIDIYNTFEVKL